jgi:DNA-binding MarR family transcriptional regulator
VKISSPDDHIDRVRAEWAAERPELDTAPVEVVGRIGRLARLLDRRLDAVFAEHGLRRDTFDVLAALRRSGPPYELSPSDLYTRLMRTSGAVTNRLQRLEREGLVERVPDPRDGRGLLVRLTARGRRLVDRAAPPHLDNERELLGALSPAEQRTLARLLRKLLLSIEGEAGAGR